MEKTETRNWIDGVFCDENEMGRLADRLHYLQRHNKNGKNDARIKEIQIELESYREGTK